MTDLIIDLLVKKSTLLCSQRQIKRSIRYRLLKLNQAKLNLINEELVNIENELTSIRTQLLCSDPLTALVRLSEELGLYQED